QLLYDGSVNDALRRVNPQRVYLIRVADKGHDAMKRLEGHNHISKLEESKYVVPEEGIDTIQIAVTLAEGVTDSSFIPDMLVPAGFKLQSLEEEEINIETAFMRLTKGITN